jgi:hypothetical protein
MELFGTANFTVDRTVASSTVLKVSWSPDSRFLLGRVLDNSCGPDEYTYQVFEARTARAWIVDSSKCKVMGNDVGWVDTSVVGQ